MTLLTIVGMITIQRFSTKIKVLEKSRKNADIIVSANIFSPRFSHSPRTPHGPRLALRGDLAETLKGEAAAVMPVCVPRVKDRP
ncbi:protein of unknown function [Methanoculleus bourgensis]|uniref:Uncharacterized protein n=1 Tax=Methanoculleus bourgensis TaxID=83986 RepID=A0A0X3BN97_9EURY|nr:protein of unknown function [Methanoculleus bourgensis]